MRVTIMMGIPGSGKTKWLEKQRPDARIFSADHFFQSWSGVYVFEPSLLGEAHRRCLRGFIQHVIHRTGDVAVDNTNTTLDQIAPYIAIASAYQRNVEVVYMAATHDIGVERNIHNVPARTIKHMRERLVRMIGHWPDRWPELTIVDTRVEEDPDA